MCVRVCVCESACVYACVCVCIWLCVCIDVTEYKFSELCEIMTKNVLFFTLLSSQSKQIIKSKPEMQFHGSEPCSRNHLTLYSPQSLQRDVRYNAIRTFHQRTRRELEG